MLADRLNYIATASANLGVAPFISMQLQKRFRSTDYELRSKELAHPVFARRETSDIRVFHQIFVYRDYRCLDNVKDAGLIIDCGANVGYSSAYFLSRYPTCKVISIEPQADNFALLRRNLAPYGERCRAIQAAVWWQVEPLNFKAAEMPGNEWAFSVQPASSNDNTVPTVTIPMLLENSQRISILKMDIEGSEREIFNHDTSWLDAVDNLVIELHGEECRQSFMRAVQRRPFHIVDCGDLTCLSIRRNGAA
jgi:FkbM family methyltransferase